MKHRSLRATVGIASNQKS